MTRVLIAAACTLLGLVPLTGTADPAPAASARIVPFDLEAHRGGRALRPENTLQSFANGLSIGVDTLELDMGVTRDGVVVISHERGLNPDLARGPDGKYIDKGIPYVQLTLAQVKSYDVGQIRPGSAYAKRFPDQRSVPGTRIPTLAEVIELVKRSGDTHVRLNIETKIDPTHPEESPDPEHFVAAVLKVLRKEKFTSRVMIESFDFRTLQLLQKQAPEIPTVYLTQVQQPEENLYLDKPSPWTAGFDPMKYGGSVPRAVKAAGGRIWSPLSDDVDAAQVRTAHELGLPVIVWTVNDPAEMARLIDLGVDGIISDRPDLLRKVAASKGIALPKPHPVKP